jgi:hypothetical protein
MIPTKLLYLGAAGEHHVMSECFRHQREAFKLPIDRGFDLVVTDAYRHLARTDAAAQTTQRSEQDEVPLYVQVKSRQAKPVLEPGNSRPRWEGCFPIKDCDLSLICDTPNAILACVLFIDTSDQLSKARTAYAWWMSSTHVTRLRDTGHFIKAKSPGALELWVRFNEPASNKEFAQNTYISLFKQHQGKNAVAGDRSSGEMMRKDCFDFGKLRSG